MIHENTFKKVDFNGAKGMVFFGDEMLVYRRDHKTTVSPGCIDLPGGGREGEETPFKAFQRELKEEFGVIIKEKEIVFSCLIPSVMEPGKKSFFMVAVIENFVAKDIVFGDEGTEWLLITPEEFITRTDCIERQQKRVEKYLNGTLVSE